MMSEQSRTITYKTKYMLKDQDLQKRLDEMSDGDFSYVLNTRANTIKLICENKRPFFAIGFGPKVKGLRRFQIIISRNEIEEVEECSH